MAYRPKPVDLTAYDAPVSGPYNVATDRYQAVDQKWYSITAYQRGGPKEATSAMKAQWEAEAQARQEQAARDQLAETNRQKEAQMQSLLQIQQQALAEQARSEQAARDAEAQEQQRLQQVEADRQARLNQDALTAANQKTDLLSENLPNVVAGGSADQSAAVASDLKKKRGAGLSTSLGINV